MSTVVNYNPNLPWSSEFLFLEEDGTVVDISGASFRMHVRAKLEADEILAEASTDNGKIQLETVTSTYQEAKVSGLGIKITLASEDTWAIYQSKAKAVSDVEVTFPDGTVEPEVISLIFNPNLSNTRDF